MGEIHITDTCIIYNDTPRGWTKGNLQPLWHRKVYQMWIDMWRRVYSDIHYFGSLIYPKYDTLSNYVKFIESQPSFEEFCNTCDKIKWCIDKDMKCSGNRNYYPEYMTLTTGSNNTKERNSRCGNSFKISKTPVIGINNNSIILLKSTFDGTKIGFNHRHISECTNKIYKQHKGYRWYKINYKHNLRLRRVQ